MPGVFTVQRLALEGQRRHLHATVQPHTSYLFLHSPEPPISFPPRLSTPLFRALQLRAAREWGGLVNFVWYPPLTSGVGARLEEKYHATLFSSKVGRMELGEVGMGDIDRVVALARTFSLGEPSSPAAPCPAGAEKEVHLYVCTHQARDCRCGDQGRRVVDALLDELGSNKRKTEMEQIGVVVKVGETGHVGGHQYAANLLVYPYGEWFGHIGPAHVPSVLDGIIRAIQEKPFAPLGTTSSPLMLAEHWRGRMGLSKEQQEALVDSWRSHP
ncbi:hypothetical protein AMATHDRAFT_82398 [Amanita thiersii Skay4041]|uniref:Sucraseferredoxin-like protein n=1 Tax=Amanita thiersii Skay4041 TaxID=703135 RepID=A0A2A9NGI6_9AGAR|nr:hypothetical protein AMATHDRAFT_82398 [Amanita thiersii Skay4041]